MAHGNHKETPNYLSHRVAQGSQKKEELSKTLEGRAKMAEALLQKAKKEMEVGPASGDVQKICFG